jgi:hypothetical protein
MLKRTPIFFLWMGIGLLLGTLPLYLYRNCWKSLLVNAYLVIQILLWLGLGYFLKKIYISAYKDELTNLWNRRYLYVRLDDEIKRLRQNSVLSLAIVDIDNFKSVNDTFGHLFGDKVLKDVAHILQNSLRRSCLYDRTLYAFLDGIKGHSKAKNNGK